MFRSARLRLTLYYLGIIMAISLLFSVAIYNISSRSLQGGFRRQAIYYQALPRYDFEPNRLMAQPNQQLADAQHQMGEDLVVLNIVILVLAGALSYYLAEQNLRPIEEALETQSRFTADASHELRTPLTAMKTEIEVALRSSKLGGAEAKALLASNLEEISKLEALSNGLLKLAQQDQGQEVAEPVKLTKVIDDAVKRVQTLMDKGGIKLERQVPDLTVRGNHDSLVEIMVILLDNAIKYSEAGKQISITAQPHGHSVRIAVRDEGQGIKPDDMPHIFDRFYRADPSRSQNQTSGYGLGLSIARKIIENLKGQISVESSPGKGATFTVTLSLAGDSSKSKA